MAGKHRACAEVGIASIERELPEDAAQEELAAVVSELNADPAVSGIIVQLPLPGHLERRTCTSAVDPAKDVDGLTPTNAGLLVQGRDGLVPATPVGRDRAAAHIRHAVGGRARGGGGPQRSGG